MMRVPHNVIIFFYHNLQSNCIFIFSQVFVCKLDIVGENLYVRKQVLQKAHVAHDKDHVAVSWLNVFTQKWEKVVVVLGTLGQIIVCSPIGGF